MPDTCCAPGIAAVYANASMAIRDAEEPNWNRYMRLTTLFALTLSAPRLKNCVRKYLQIRAEDAGARCHEQALQFRGSLRWAGCWQGATQFPLFVVAWHGVHSQGTCRMLFIKCTSQAFGCTSRSAIALRSCAQEQEMQGGALAVRAQHILMNGHRHIVCALQVHVLHVVRFEERVCELEAVSVEALFA
jgi:hypothetical protein